MNNFSIVWLFWETVICTVTLWSLESIACSYIPHNLGNFGLHSKCNIFNNSSLRTMRLFFVGVAEVAKVNSGSNELSRSADHKWDTYFNFAFLNPYIETRVKMIFFSQGVFWIVMFQQNLQNFQITLFSHFQMRSILLECWEFIFEFFMS